MEILSNDPPPEYVRIVELYTRSGGDGYKAFQIYEIEKGKEEEGFRYISRGLVEIMNAIEGYRGELNVVYNMAGALEFLGMEAPAV